MLETIHDLCGRFSSLSRLRDYETFWHDIKSYSHYWRDVIVPSHCAFDMGASEEVYSALIGIVGKRIRITSPVISMRSEKNKIEREGMRKAHIIDSVAMCEALSLLDQKVELSNVYNKSMSRTYSSLLFALVHSKP